MTNKLTQEDVAQIIMNLGFKEYRGSVKWPTARCFEGYRLGELPCECNGRAPNLYVQVYPDLDMDGTLISGHVTFSIFGEVDGLWFEAQVFSVKRDRVAESFEKVKYSLSSVWNSYWNSIKEFDEMLED